MAVSSRSKSLWRIVRHFADTASMHGVGNINHSRTKIHRSIWIIFLLIAIALLFRQIYGVTLKYFWHPISTELIIDHTTPLTFPTITICNLNPIHVRMVKDMDLLNPKQRNPRQADFISTPDPPSRDPPTTKPEMGIGTEIARRTTKLKDDTARTTSQPQITTTEHENFTYPNQYDERLPSKNANYYRSRDESDAIEVLQDIIEDKDQFTNITSNAEKVFLRKQKLMFAINNVNPKVREALTYSIKDILVECSFLGKKCSMEDFAVIKNAHYGNCFVFNGGMNLQKTAQPLRQLYVSGSEQSLTLTLFVDQQSYLAKYSPVAGYKVVIHSAEQPAIPDEEGFLVKPGQFTALATKLRVIKRAKQPYGRCKEFTRENNRSMNMFLDQLPLTTPSVPVCLRTCEQLRIIQHCGCYSMRLGFADAEAFAVEKRNRSYIPSCSINQAGGDRNCVDQIINEVTDGKLGCKEECYFRKCTSNNYETKASAAAWPALHSFQRFENKLTGSRIPAIRDYWSKVKAQNSTRDDEDRIDISRSFIRENFVKLQVYMSDLTVVTMKTHASYTFIDMLADFGGNGGLWLGISVFSIFEVCIFIVNFCRGLYAHVEEDDKAINSRTSIKKNI